MQPIKILKRAFNITVNYRVLWIFGILLALTTGGGGSGGGSGGSSGGNGSSGSANLPGTGGQNLFGQFPEITPAMTGATIAAVIGLTCLMLVLIVAGSIIRYVSETAVIRMVDRYEQDGEKLSFRQGFRLGWSRAAWKLFLMDLLIGLSFAAVFLLLLAIAALPLLVFFARDAVALQVVGGVLAAGLLMLVILAAIVLGLAVSLVMLIAQRFCVLEDLGVRDSLRQAFGLVRRRLADSLLMGVSLFGVGLLWALITIPVILAVLVVAILAGGLPALLVGGIGAMLTQGSIPWIAAALVGIPIFLLVIMGPALLLGGWQKIYVSSAWTLAYREMSALVKTQPAPTEIPTDEPAAAS